MTMLGGRGTGVMAGEFCKRLTYHIVTLASYECQLLMTRLRHHEG